MGLLLLLRTVLYGILLRGNLHHASTDPQNIEFYKGTNEDRCWKDCHDDARYSRGCDEESTEPTAADPIAHHQRRTMSSCTPSL